MKKSKGFTPLESINSRGKNKTRKPLTGFTIIELLVVVAIIAVLVAIVMSNINRYIIEARTAAVRSGVSEIQKSGPIYFSDNGDYNGFCESSYVKNHDQNLQNAGGIYNCWVDEEDDAWCFCSTTDYHTFF